MTVLCFIRTRLLVDLKFYEAKKTYDFSQPGVCAPAAADERGVPAPPRHRALLLRLRHEHQKYFYRLGTVRYSSVSDIMY